MASTSVVDNKLCYKDETHYKKYNKRAARLWNKIGPVQIKKASSSCPKNLTIVDKKVSRHYDGMYLGKKIILNSRLLDKRDKECRAAISVHEMGHALGLEHGRKGDIMWAWVCAEPEINRPQKKDKDHLRAYWKDSSYPDPPPAVEEDDNSIFPLI